MIAKKELYVKISFIVLGILFLCISPGTGLAQTPVKAGDIINSGNLEQYEAYFPLFIKMFIKDGANGITEPIKIKVKDPVTTLPLSSFMEASKKNIGKVTLNSDNTVTGHEAGFPFPDAKEPNLAEKTIWNFYFRWRGDSQELKEPQAIGATRQRRGGPIAVAKLAFSLMNVVNRVTVPPVPSLPNPDKLFWVQAMKFLQPPNKNMRVLTFRYLDDKKTDDMWTYIPSLRRTLRMVSSERANPVSGSPATWDDFFGFDGKITEFNYKLMGEQKILALMDQKGKLIDYPGGYKKPIFDTEPWEIRDAVVIEITAKNPRYPESKREIWITKDIWYSPYAMTYDKRGDLWKGCYNSFGEMETEQGEKGYLMMFNSFVDFKTDFWTAQIVDKLIMNNPELKLTSFSPGNFYSEF